MKIEAQTASRPVEEVQPQRPPLREETRPARGLLIGLALSSIIWLGLLVLWLAL